MGFFFKENQIFYNYQQLFAVTGHDQHNAKSRHF